MTGSRLAPTAQDVQTKLGDIDDFATLAGHQCFQGLAVDCVGDRSDRAIKKSRLGGRRAEQAEVLQIVQVQVLWLGPRIPSLDDLHQ